MRSRLVVLTYGLILSAGVVFLACDAIEDKLLDRPPGERLYRKHCARCHGLDGAGSTVAGNANPSNDLLDDRWEYGGETGTMENLVREGIFGEMPAHPEFTDLQVRQVIDHVLKLRGSSRRSG